MFDEIDSELSTKDRQVVADKLHLLEAMMLDFLQDDCLEEFIARTLGMDAGAVKEDMSFYRESLDVLLEKTVKIDSKLRDERNMPSLLAMMVYSYQESYFCGRSEKELSTDERRF